jgi:hypothetical protein
MAWLLKTVAIELKVTATHMHHSQLGNLVNLLVREQGEEMVAVSVEENAPSEVREMATIMQLSHYLATPSSEFIYKFLLVIYNTVKYSKILLRYFMGPAAKNFLREKTILISLMLSLLDSLFKA